MSKDYHHSPSLKEILDRSFGDMRRASYVWEGFKGCCGAISREPVSLEPSFKSYSCMDFGKPSQVGIDPDLCTIDDSVIDWRYLRVWFAKQDDAFKSQEAFRSLLNRLGALGQKFKVTLGGSKERVSLIVGVDKNNVSPAKNAIASIYPLSEIDISEENPLFEKLRKDNSLGFLEYFSPPPYWRSLSCPDHRFTASLLPCLCSEVGAGEVGFIELIIQPGRNDWGSNIFNLCNAEREGGVPLHVSRDWRQASFGIDYSDKTKQKISLPMFAATIRVGACCDDGKLDSVLKTLSLPVAGLLWSGQRLKYVTEQDFIKVIGEKKTRDMIVHSKTYRPGSLYSLDELSSLSPFFEKEDLTNPRFSLDKASGIYVPDEIMNKEGALIGNVYVAGKSSKYYLEEKHRRRGMSICGDMGSGKTRFMAQMIIHDFRRKRKLMKKFPELKMSMFVFDFSGDLFRLVMNNLSEEDLEYVDVFDPTLEGYVPLFNVVELKEGEDVDKRADDLTNHLTRLFPGNEFSLGIQQCFRNGFPLVLRDPEARFLDLKNIFDNTDEAKGLRARILQEYFADNQELNDFWKHFDSVDARTRNLVARKVGMFFSQKRMQQMFGGKVNRFNASKIMNSGRMLLGNLDEGAIGETPSSILGDWWMGNVISASKERKNLYSPKELELMPCHVVMDEFFKSPPKSFESAVVSLRKFNVSLTLSYHFQEQLSKKLQMGLKNFSTHVVFKQSYDEAKRAHAQFLGKVDSTEFMNLRQRWGYVIKPNSEAVKFETINQEDRSNETVINKIMEKNLNENYVKVSDLKKEDEEKKGLKKEALKKTKKGMGEPI